MEGDSAMKSSVLHTVNMLFSATRSDILVFLLTLQTAYCKADMLTATGSHKRFYSVHNICAAMFRSKWEQPLVLFFPPTLLPSESNRRVSRTQKAFSTMVLLCQQSTSPSDCELTCGSQGTSTRMGGGAFSFQVHFLQKQL